MPWTMWDKHRGWRWNVYMHCLRNQWLHTLGVFPTLCVFSTLQGRPKIRVEFSPGTTGYKDRNQTSDTPLPIPEPVSRKLKQWEPHPFPFCKHDCSLKAFKMGMVQKRPFWKLISNSKSCKLILNTARKLIRFYITIQIWMLRLRNIR